MFSYKYIDKTKYIYINSRLACGMWRFPRIHWHMQVINPSTRRATRLTRALSLNWGSEVWLLGSHWKSKMAAVSHRKVFPGCDVITCDVISCNVITWCIMGVLMVSRHIFIKILVLILGISSWMIMCVVHRATWLNWATSSFAMLYYSTRDKISQIW